MATTPPTQPATPDVPDRADRANFPTKMYNMFVFLVGDFWTYIGAALTNAYNNAVDASNSASAAAASEVNSEAAQAAAEAAQAAAEAAAGATIWISGTTYAIGDVRWSPINYTSYRRKTNGAGTTDPSADPTNWASITPDSASWTVITADPAPAVVCAAYMCNTTSAAFTVTLPAAPSADDTVMIADYAGTFATNNLTVGRNALKINGATEDFILDISNETRTFTYIDATQGWRVA